MTHISIDNKKFVFVGCSLSVGEGLEGEKQSPKNYTNIIGTEYNATILNLGKKGNSNFEIFQTAINQILFSKLDFIFVQWTSLKRYWCYPDPYAELFISLSSINEFQIGDVYFSKNEIKKFTEWFYLLHHDYQAVINVINYSKILSETAKNKDINIIFINGHLPWESDIQTNVLLNNAFENLSDSTKELLNFNNRDDNQIQELYTKLNKLILDLNNDQWVNMFKSLTASKIDIGSDNVHPGPKSHQIWADMIIKYLEEKYG
jgi:hypothetical protein